MAVDVATTAIAANPSREGVCIVYVNMFGVTQKDASHSYAEDITKLYNRLNNRCDDIIYYTSP